MGYQETITFILEMIGTIAFAASGALVGSEQKMDIFGVSVLGVITAVGGDPYGGYISSLCWNVYDSPLCGQLLP